MQMEHFFSPNSGEDQKTKKKVFIKNRTLFPQFSLRCTPIQIIGVDTAKLLGVISPHPTLVSAPLTTL